MELLMKRWCVALCAFLAWPLISPRAEEKIPTIAFESLTKDFGKVNEGETLKHIFKFKNRGLAPLQILKVEPS